MHAFNSHQNLDFLPIPIPHFGAWIRHRRLSLGLNCARAATSAGINRDQWMALEQGWVPKIGDENFLRSLAGTLEVKFDALSCAIAPLEAHFAAVED